MLDKNGLEILKILQRDCRLSVKEIGRITESPKSTVYARIKRMCEQLGVELGDEPEGLELPDLERFWEHLQLPEIHWKPAPLWESARG